MHIHSAIRRPLVAAHLLWTAFATAQFDDFYWSVNNECPGYVGFNCTAPQQACAYHGLLNKWYCCGGDDGVCWTNAIRCQSNQTQTLCGSGNDRFCCLNQYEQCSQRQNQINICWSTSTDVISNVTSEYLGVVYASLSSASPEATTFTFDASALAVSFSSTTTTASSTTGSMTSATATADATTDAPSPTPVPSPSSLSGGAIAGIVIGVIGGLAVIALVGFLIWRRRKTSAASTSPYVGSHGDVAQASPSAAGWASDRKSPPVQQYDSQSSVPQMKQHHTLQELPGEGVYGLRSPSELPANREPGELGL